MKRTVLGVAAILLLIPLSVTMREATAGEPQLPEPLRAVVEIGSPERLSAHLGEFSAAVSGAPPAPLPLQILVPQLLSTQDAGTVDLSSPVRVLILQPPLHSCPAVVFGAKDAGAYLASMAGTVKQEEGWGDILRYEGPGPFRAIGVAGNQVVLSTDVSAAKAVVDLIKDGRLTAEPLLPGADVAVAVRLRMLLEEITETSGNPFDAVREALTGAMEQAAVAGGQPAMPAATKAMLKAELDGLERISRQVETLAATFSFGATGIDAKMRMEAAPGSTLAAYIVAIPGGDFRTLPYVPADSMAAGVAKIGDLTPLLEWYRGLFRESLAAAGMEPDKADRFVGLMKNALALYGDEMSFAMSASPDGPLNMTECILVKDPAALSALLPEIAAMTREMSDLYKAMGMEMSMEVDPAAAAYKGHEIAGWHLQFRFQPPGGMEPGQADEAARAMQEAMEKVLGGPELTMHSAFLGNDWLLTVGKDSLAALEKLMDGEVTALSLPAEREPLAEGVKPLAVGYLSLSELANWYVRLLGSMPAGAALPIDLSAMKFEKGAGVWMSAHCADNGVECSVTVPAGDLRAIVEGFKNAAARPPAPQPEQP